MPSRVGNFPLLFSFGLPSLLLLSGWLIGFLTGDSTTLAGLKRQLSASIPLTVLNDKFKEKDDAHVLVVADLQAARTHQRNAG